MDTSALVPLLMDEPASQICGQLWDDAEKVACTRLGYVEAVAAIAMAERLGRVSVAQAIDSRGVLDDIWPAVDVIELDRALMDEAATMAVRHGLRGYDATHCAAAVGVSDSELVAASGDKSLLAAWRAEGVMVYDTAAA